MQFPTPEYIDLVKKLARKMDPNDRKRVLERLFAINDELLRSTNPPSFKNETIDTDAILSAANEEEYVENKLAKIKELHNKYARSSYPRKY